MKSFVFAGIVVLILVLIGVGLWNTVNIHKLQERQDFLEEYACIKNMINVTERVEYLEYRVDSLGILLNEILR